MMMKIMGKERRYWRKGREEVVSGEGRTTKEEWERRREAWVRNNWRERVGEVVRQGKSKNGRGTRGVGEGLAEGVFIGKKGHRWHW
ncbi:hypothetical protein E2C01_024165 [Portunus trituberculatus]|uniref:Uncharacterized protein n=1 Tax=Portunus trituberculatus TaxID=210409 RepID=A0A5B7EDN5_PORTR|nr:hypothetical protein [Portunus trituberculatus]